MVGRPPCQAIYFGPKSASAYSNCDFQLERAPDAATVLAAFSEYATALRYIALVRSQIGLGTTRHSRAIGEAMTVTINLGEILTHVASVIAIIGGIVAFARFIKWWWNRPAERAE